ncbi:hypothetical protein DH2020_000896 [Rehmannia glutinosa]|uniref:NB-ARC domain-containing protein n=1 Tax=Rehmannia glutinosa TaxID=99300 RepID=A0ABR0XXS1_REHGL
MAVDLNTGLAYLAICPTIKFPISSRHKSLSIKYFEKQIRFMADAIVSIAVQRLEALVEKQIGTKINLVREVKNEECVGRCRKKKIQREKHTILAEKLEDTSYDIDNVLDEWNFAILKLEIQGSKDFVPRQKVRSYLNFSKVATRHDIAKKIKGLKERLDRIVNEKDRYDFIVGQPVDLRESDRVRSTSLLDVSEIHGREVEKDVLVSKLMIQGGVGEKELKNPSVISIVGTGGIGKTTLAQLLYNDDTVKNNFNERIWICVSDVFDEVRIAKGIVEIVRGVVRISMNWSRC